MNNKGKRDITVTKPHSSVKLVDNEKSYNSMIELIRTLSGPIAMDSERACGFRYDNNKAYMIQIKRENAIFII